MCMAQVDEVSGIMKKNVEQMLLNADTLSSLQAPPPAPPPHPIIASFMPAPSVGFSSICHVPQEKADETADYASNFQRAARDQRRQVQFAALKMKALIALALVAVFLVVFGPWIF